MKRFALLLVYAVLAVLLLGTLIACRERPDTLTPPPTPIVNPENLPTEDNIVWVDPEGTPLPIITPTGQANVTFGTGQDMTEEVLSAGTAMIAPVPGVQWSGRVIGKPNTDGPTTVPEAVVMLDMHQASNWQIHATLVLGTYAPAGEPIPATAVVQNPNAWWHVTNVKGEPTDFYVWGPYFNPIGGGENGDRDVGGGGTGTD